MPLVETAVALAVFLLIRVGQTLLLAGSVRSKNAAGIAVRLLLDQGAIVLALYLVGGFFLPVGTERGWFFPSHLLGISPHAGLAVLALAAPAVVMSGAILGTVAERTRLLPMLILSAALTAVVLPLLVRLAGAMPQVVQPVINPMGLAVMLGGGAALAAARSVGARKGKYNRDQSVNFVPGHNVMLQLVGLMLLALGFAAASGNTVNVLLAFAAASLAAAGFGSMRFGKIDVGLTLAGAMGGLASVAAGAFAMPGWAAVLAGLVAGVAVPWSVLRIETEFRIDDVTSAGSSHLVGGAIGLLVAALLHHGTFGARMSALLGNVILGLLAIAAAAGAGLLIARLFAQSKALRLSETAEFDGTDLSELDVNAYPDFQQTMIKSYHLREL